MMTWQVLLVAGLVMTGLALEFGRALRTRRREDSEPTETIEQIIARWRAEDAQRHDD